jgi:hypothetical protein
MKFLDFLEIKVVLKRIEHVDITPNLLLSAQCLQLCGTTKCGTQKYKILDNCWNFSEQICPKNKFKRKNEMV